MASQMTVSGQDLNQRAVTRPGEILEAAPGLAVVAHADGGKANQYYLRGYNLDHGTDLAIFVDDMPINLPTHAHGQGYADLNWLMPETVNSLDVRKGPYFADVGDFATAGSLFINLRDSVDKNVAEVTLGSFGYQRYFAMGSTKLGGGSLLYAGETNFYNGPWDTPDHMHKFTGLVRYSQGTATDGFSATAMAYSNTWTTTEQVPARAIKSGHDRTLRRDRSDRRRRYQPLFALGAHGANRRRRIVEGQRLCSSNTSSTCSTISPGFSPIRSTATSFSSTTIASMAAPALRAPSTARCSAGRRKPCSVSRSRYDDIDLALNNTVQRQFLSSVLADHVNEGNAGIYAENTVHWTDWLRTTLGWRGDYYAASVNSILQPANSGKHVRRHRQPQIPHGVRPVRQDGILCRRRHGLSQQRCAQRRPSREVPGDPTTPEVAIAIAGALARRRSRRSHQDRSRPR